MELYSSIIKEFLIFSQKKASLLIRGKSIPPNIFIFQETECSNILENGNTKNFLMFLEVSFLVRNIKKPTLQKLLIFQET